MKKIIICLGLIILTGCFNKESNQKDYTNDYKQMEKEFLTAGKTFMNNNENLIPKNNEVYSIKLDNLYLSDFLKSKLIDPKTKNECDKENSYIHVTNSNDKITYKVFLMCDSYQTKQKD